MGQQLKPHDAVMASSRQALGVMDAALARRGPVYREQSLYGQEHPVEGPLATFSTCGCGGRCDGRMGCLSVPGAR
jgi:hypothetical protein